MCVVFGSSDQGQKSENGQHYQFKRPIKGEITEFQHEQFSEIVVEVSFYKHVSMGILDENGLSNQYQIGVMSDCAFTALYAMINHESRHTW